ncbi:uncharacterized protein LOC143300779 [Babylonia areolata]|uniref:uncharacterized protein LOC143300779 n=1 Tax=Babylonia areolata TaxID=304850 RepID=UPI003FD461D6
MDQELFEEVSHVIYGFLLPSVCVFGMVGNVLNLAILTRRKLQKSFRTLEQAANLCLISLAVSDLMFCVFAFPSMFLPEDDVYRSRGVLLTYRVYGTAIINVFIMMSTWLTVAMSLERYLAICHPLRQDLYLTTRRIKIVIALTYILSFIFNIPVLWRYEVQEICPDQLACLDSSALAQVALWGSSQVDMVYRLLWAVVNNVIPLLLLVYFNVCLCRKIYRSYKMRQKFKQEHHSRHENSSHVLTVTLVVIVLMFFVLVAPSEIVIHTALATNNNNSYTYRSVEAVMNFMQSLNFSVNFILYCIISPYFRKTLKYLFCCGCYNIHQVSRQWKKDFETSLISSFRMRELRPLSQHRRHTDTRVTVYEEQLQMDTSLLATIVAYRKSAGIASFSQMVEKTSWNALRAVVPSALNTSAGTPSFPGAFPQFICSPDFILSGRVGVHVLMMVTKRLLLIGRRSFNSLPFMPGEQCCPEEAAQPLEMLPKFSAVLAAFMQARDYDFQWLPPPVTFSTPTSLQGLWWHTNQLAAVRVDDISDKLGDWLGRILFSVDQSFIFVALLLTGSQTLHIASGVRAAEDLADQMDQELFEEVSHVIYGFLVPFVCMFGMVGNVLNLVILTRRKLQKSIGTLEQSANLCLILLAVSDLMFCVFAFPSIFLPDDDVYRSRGVLLTYRLYCAAIINVFIMTSTWLTVAMSLERYLAICHPLRQDLYLTTRRIKIVIALTYILSFIFNIPVLWRYEVQEICPDPLACLDFSALAQTALSSSSSDGKRSCSSREGQLNINATVESLSGVFANFTLKDSGEVLMINSSSFKRLANVENMPATANVTVTTLVETVVKTVHDEARTPLLPGAAVGFRPNQVALWGSSQVDMVYRLLWAVVNNVIPLLLLVFFNVCLYRSIYRSYKMRQKFKQEHHSHQENPSHVLTVTLVVIVIMFFVLVAPSEIVIHTALLTNNNNSYNYMSVEAVMNFMQTLNFSVNFILYCIISPYFRKTLKYLFCCGCYNIHQGFRLRKKDLAHVHFQVPAAGVAAPDAASSSHGHPPHRV